MSLKRPMLAVAADEPSLRALSWPRLASAKIDGVRALCIRGSDGRPVLVSRTLKPIPNKHVQDLFAHEYFIGLDGELAVGYPWDKNLMQQTMSGVMSEDGTPDVVWHVFDKWDEDGPYHARARAAKAATQRPPDTPQYDCTAWLPQIPIKSYDELVAMEEGWLEQGYEGLILRCPNAPYKQNRSTLKQAYMLKMKRFADSEAEVLDVVELMHNDNEATTDARGYTKRSTHAAGKTAAGVLGALQVRDIHTKVEFELGTGFTAEQRANLWEGRKYLTGKLVKYKHFPIGVKDKPRHPVFIGFRDKRDI